MKILFAGDIVGSPGRDAVRGLLPGLKKEFGLDFAVANAENAAGGSGITARISQDLFDAGVDVLTSGDHIWKKSDIFEIIEREPRIIRPVNFPPGAPGRGAEVFSAGDLKVGVVNVQGRVFMEALDCPFRAVNLAVEELRKKTKIIIV
ncbi:MAG: YmdB family metallophosphoesterase, partial [Candidatus Omnitrophica bacterium]|nr:YmdB family metallophosphoesterase [Candidatus Omnitrophota bacterium]